MTPETKKQIGIRIPTKLNRRLENHIKKIGISKQAFILNLIFSELEEKEKDSREDDDEIEN